MIALSLGKENPKAPFLHNTLPWHTVGYGRRSCIWFAICGGILHYYFAILQLLTSRTLTQALRPRGSSQQLVPDVVSEKDSPRRLPPKSPQNRHKMHRNIRRTLLRNPQATMILQGAARILTQFAKLGGCVIVQLACKMVQLTMCHARLDRRQ